MTGGFDEEGQAHKKVVVALGGINEEVHGLAGTVIGLRLFHLIPELLVFRRAVGGIHLQRTGVDSGEEIKAKLGLGGGGEDKGEDAPAQRLPQERGDGLTDAGGVDDDTAAVPDVFQEVDELGVEFGVALSSPGVVFDDFD